MPISVTAVRSRSGRMITPAPPSRATHRGINDRPPPTISQSSHSQSAKVLDRRGHRLYAPGLEPLAMCAARMLVAMFQGGGNIPLLLPIVTRLVARGHDVRFIVGPGVRRSRLPVSDQLWDALVKTGAPVVALRE